MSRGINKFIGIGNCCSDPELRHSPGGASVTNVTIACNESYKDKDGKKVERAEFVKVVFFGKLAEIAVEYLRKGSQVYIEGRLQTDKYDKDGQAHYTTRIIANQMQMLDGKKETSPSDAGGISYGGAAPSSNRAPSFDDLDVPF